jgi:hypothetical protein
VLSILRPLSDLCAPGHVCAPCKHFRCDTATRQNGSSHKAQKNKSTKAQKHKSAKAQTHKSTNAQTHKNTVPPLAPTHLAQAELLAFAGDPP